MSKKNEPRRSFLLRIAIGAGSFIMWILSFSAVRSWIWNRVETKGKEKIVDAKAKIVKKDKKKTFLK